jgi:site-specific DNA recombinase
MRVLIAARLSKKLKDRTQTGLETQDAGMTAWAEYEGHTVTAVVGDFKSGTVQPWKRPNLRKWVGTQDENGEWHTDPEKLAQFDAIAAWRFDRLSRGDKQSTNEIELWAHQHGKQLLTEDGLSFPSEGVDGIRWDLAARMAHDEWMKIRERAIRAQKRLRAGGYLVGRAPYGCRIIGAEGGEHKTLEADPVTGPIVKAIAERYLDGDSLQDICDWLNGRGIPSPAFKRDKVTRQRTDEPAAWIPKTLSQVLRNPAIAGRRKDGLRFKGVIELADYDAIIRRMDSRAHRKGISPKNVSLLTSILFCKKCQGPMYRIKTRDGLFYYCKSRQDCHMMTEIDQTNAAFETFLKTHLVKNPLKRNVTIPGHNHDEAINQVARDLRELDQLADDYDSEHDRLRAELARLRALPAEADQVKVEEIPGARILADWAGMDTAGRRDLLLSLAMRMLVSKDADGKITLALAA